MINMNDNNEKQFLPISIKEMKKRGWDSLDYIIVNGDAYVDHPSFGAAIIGRLLEAYGYRVGMIAQPDWKRLDDFKKLGKPKYAFLVASGNLDSMVNHYYVSGSRRKQDVFSPGGKSGRRPDRAVCIYTAALKKVFPDVPVIIGGVEASLRRFAHYDYWSDKVLPSILYESGADLLLYGMAEHQIREIAEWLKNDGDIAYAWHIPGTCFLVDDIKNIYGYREIPSYKEAAANKKKFAEAFKIISGEQDPVRGETLIQRHGNKFLVQNPPAMPLTEAEMDFVYGLPYTRRWHTLYDNMNGVPALQEVKYSITGSRGCFGSCSFCSLSFHQGRIVTSRSHTSIIGEAEEFLQDPSFKGYIHDISGPTANFRQPACSKQLTKGACKQRQCLFPRPCPQLEVSHRDLLELLRKLRVIKGIKKVFLRSGLRYDYIVYDKDTEFVKELCEHHISGQLKVAPEHIDEAVLLAMGKPSGKIYQRFAAMFEKFNKRAGKNQYVLPYFMSSHPGSDLNAAIALAEYMQQTGCHVDQVQDFYPTPGTMATCMYHTGIDPRTMTPVYVPSSTEEKLMQRALLHYQKAENRAMVEKALKKADRSDLIGTGKQCLLRPERPAAGKSKKIQRKYK